jgi:hypothetical protein
MKILSVRCDKFLTMDFCQKREILCRLQMNVKVYEVCGIAEEVYDKYVENFRCSSRQGWLCQGLVPGIIHSSTKWSEVKISLFFFYLVCEAIGTAATPGLLCQPRVIVKMIVEKQVECRLAGETEVLLGENLPHRHFCPSQNPHMTRPGFEPGPPLWEAGD